MMNIIVLVKPVFEAKSIQWDYENNSLCCLVEDFNRTDLHALQWAAWHRKKYNSKVTVVSVADQDQMMNTKRLKNFDFDQFYVIRIKNFISNRQDAAPFLKSFFERTEYDLILTGSESEDYHNGTTAVLLSEFLGIPAITHIYHIERAEEHRLKVYRKEDRGNVNIYGVELPAILGVTSQISKLRYRPILHRNEMDPHVVTFSRGTERSPFIVEKTCAPEPNIRYVKTPESALSAEHRLLQIMGLDTTNGEGTKQKVSERISKEHIHFASEKLKRWLKE